MTTSPLQLNDRATTDENHLKSTQEKSYNCEHTEEATVRLVGTAEMRRGWSHTRMWRLGTGREVSAVEVPPLLKSEGSRPHS